MDKDNLIKGIWIFLILSIVACAICGIFLKKSIKEVDENGKPLENPEINFGLLLSTFICGLIALILFFVLLSIYGFITKETSGGLVSISICSIIITIMAMNRKLQKQSVTTGEVWGMIILGGVAFISGCLSLSQGNPDDD